MLENGGDASLQEGKVHETDAAQVRLLLVFCDDLAETSDDVLRGRAESHDTLVLRGDRQVVQGKAGQVTAISTLLGEALGQGSQYIVLSTADHRDTVLLVSDIAQFVDVLGGGGTLFTLGVQHGVDQVRDVVKCRGLGRGALGRLCSSRADFCFRVKSLLFVVAPEQN